MKLKSAIEFLMLMSTYKNLHHLNVIARSPARAGRRGNLQKKGKTMAFDIHKDCFFRPWRNRNDVDIITINTAIKD
jgi:hypothetical protein